MDSLVQIFDKVKNNYNNSLEAWNKGLTISYTMFSAITDNVTYEWEITTILTQDEVHLPCYVGTKPRFWNTNLQDVHILKHWFKHFSIKRQFKVNISQLEDGLQP